MSSPRLLPLAGLLLGAATPATAPVFPPRALILFVASWCTPCRVELRQIDAIAAAAAPIEVRVTPLDRSAATVAMLRGVPVARVWRSARAVDALMQDSGALPFSVMTDAAGHPCATHDRGLDATAVSAMRRRCDKAGQ